MNTIISYAGKNIEEMSREEILAAFRVAVQEIKILRDSFDGYIKFNDELRRVRRISA